MPALTSWHDRSTENGETGGQNVCYNFTSVLWSPGKNAVGIINQSIN